MSITFLNEVIIRNTFNTSREHYKRIMYELQQLLQRDKDDLVRVRRFSVQRKSGFFTPAKRLKTELVNRKLCLIEDKTHSSFTKVEVK